MRRDRLNVIEHAIELGIETMLSDRSCTARCVARWGPVIERAETTSPNGGRRVLRDDSAAVAHTDTTSRWACDSLRTQWNGRTWLPTHERGPTCATCGRSAAVASHVPAVRTGCE